MSITSITPQKLSDLIHSCAAVELIDVRTPIEYREVHVSCARNVPLDHAFVGAGFTLAGITDTCGMGMLLARMPWNQVPKSTPTGATGSGAACALQSTCCG
jgi:hypothetical protein